MQENKNIPSSSSYAPKNYRLMKCKGKPFWLNLEQNRSKNYERYKSQLNPETSFAIKQQQCEQIIPLHENHNHTRLQNEQCVQINQSLNQNYSDDFQSFKTTIKQEKQPIYNDKQQLNINPSQTPKHNKLTQLQIKSATRKVNFSQLSRVHTDKIKKHNLQRSRIKTQQPTLMSYSVDINREICMHENSKYLVKENEKLLTAIRQLRKLLPILILNHQQINSQRWQLSEVSLFLILSQLADQVQKATSANYTYELEKNKSLLQSSRKLMQKNIKVLNSPKKNNSQLFKNKYQSELSLSYEDRLREELLAKLRLSTLREEKCLKLDEKINLYKQMIQQKTLKQKIQSFSTLQRRKIFLQWDLDRMKNDFDLKILQEKLHINELIQELQTTQRKIQEYSFKTKRLPIIVTPKKQNIKKSQSHLSKLPDKSSPFDLKTNFYQHNLKQKHLLSLHQKSLPEISENKDSVSFHFQPSIQGKQKRNKNMFNSNIRGNKFEFKNTNFNKDFQFIML